MDSTDLQAVDGEIAGQSDRVIRCPKCFQRDVRPSRQQGLIDWLMKKVNRVAYRCRFCKARFHPYVRAAE